MSDEEPTSASVTAWERAQALRIDLDMDEVRALFEARGVDVRWMGYDWAPMELTDWPVTIDVFPTGSVQVRRLWIREVPKAIALLQALYDEAMRQEATA